MGSLTTLVLSAYDLVTQRLTEVTGYTPRGGKGDWKCPAHDDSNPSLSVNQGDKGVILNCHSFCTPEEVVAALSLTMADLFDKDNEPKETPKEVASYTYTDEQGKYLFEAVRFWPKDFRQRVRQAGGGFVWKLGDTRRVLYHLPRVLAGISEDQVVYVVEGEKDVHSVESEGYVATCNPMGAGKWRPEYSDSLRGADVLVVADNDATGMRHAREVEASLVGIANRVAILRPAEGKDVTDHLHAGLSLGQLLELSDDEPPPPPEPGQEILESVRPLHRTVLDLKNPPLPTPILWRGLYGGGCLTVLQSEPGFGKSWLALWLMLKVLHLGWSVVYLDEEGGSELVTSRLIALGADPGMVAERVFYYPFPSREWTPEDIIALDAEIMRAHKAGLGCALGIFDSLPDFLASAGKNEDFSMDVTNFLRNVCGRFTKVGAAQLLLDHISKPQTDQRRRSRYSRGSGAKLAKADATLLLESVDEFDATHSGRVRLWKTKDRRGQLDLPTLGNDGLDLDVVVRDGTLTIQELTESESRRRYRPTEMMRTISLHLEVAPDHTLSKRSIRTLVMGDNNVSDSAIELLKQDRFVTTTTRGLKLVRPFRPEGDDVEEPDESDKSNEPF